MDQKMSKPKPVSAVPVLLTHKIPGSLGNREGIVITNWIPTKSKRSGKGQDLCWMAQSKGKFRV